MQDCLAANQLSPEGEGTEGVNIVSGQMSKSQMWQV